VLRVNTIILTVSKNSIIAWGQTLLSLHNVGLRTLFYSPLSCHVHFERRSSHFRPFSRIEKTDSSERIAQRDLLRRVTKVFLLSSFMAGRVSTPFFQCCHVRVEKSTFRETFVLHIFVLSQSSSERIAQRDLLCRVTKAFLLSSFMAGRVSTPFFQCCHVRVEKSTFRETFVLHIFVLSRGLRKLIEKTDSSERITQRDLLCRATNAFLLSSFKHKRNYQSSEAFHGQAFYIKSKARTSSTCCFSS
jgi:hypothetical protein